MRLVVRVHRSGSVLIELLFPPSYPSGIFRWVGGEKKDEERRKERKARGEKSDAGFAFVAHICRRTSLPN